MLSQDRLHTIGWGTALAFCLALVAVLTMRVNAVKSQVALADRQIAAVTRDKLYLETEFETRASQQQLRAMNDVDFGYAAPGAGQFIKSERDLAAYGQPAAPDAPAPIRFALSGAGAEGDARAPASGSGLSGRLIEVAHAAEAPAASTPAAPSHAALRLASLNERLSHLDRPLTRQDGARE